MAENRQKLTDKTDLVEIQDADLIHVVDVSDTTATPEGTSKKSTWSLFKDTIKTFLDPFYQTSPTATRIVSGGMVWVSGLTYESVDLIYEVNGVQFTITDGTEATLDAAPTTSTFERFDVIYGDEDGNILIEKGTESATPTIPTLETSYQLSLTVALLLTNATEPDGVEELTVYEEDLGQPTEYDVTENTGGVRIDVADASTPISGAVSIKCIANLVTGDTVNAVHATPVQVDEFTYLRMSIKSLRDWGNDFIEIRLRNVSTVVATFKINKKVIDVTNVSIPQILTIFKANFSSYGDTEFDNIDFYNRSTNKILYILDDIYIQTGVANTEPTTGIGADEVTTDTSNFDGNLSSVDDTVQKALDTLDDLVLGGTPTLQEVTDQGSTTNNQIDVSGIVNNQNTPTESYEIMERGISLGFPVASFRPRTANQTIALDLMPNGTVVDFGYNGLAWFDIVDTDVKGVNPALNVLRQGIGQTRATFGCIGFNGATLKPLDFLHGAAGASVGVAGTIETDGVLNWLKNIFLGDETPTATATPLELSLGATYSNTVGANPKFKIYDDGSTVFGLGVTANQMEFLNPAGKNFAFFDDGVLTFKIKDDGTVNMPTLSVYANDAAAASLSQGDVYQTVTGELRIKL